MPFLFPFLSKEFVFVCEINVSVFFLSEDVCFFACEYSAKRDRLGDLHTYIHAYIHTYIHMQ